MARPLPFSAQDVIDSQLFGIPLFVKVRDPNGVVVTQTYPTSRIEVQISAAINWMERELQMDIYPRRIMTKPEAVHPQAVLGEDFDLAEDPYDYGYESFYANGYFRTRRYPIISLDMVQLRFPGDTTLLTYPPEWLRVNHKSGQVNIIAYTGVTQPLIIGREGGFLPFLSGGLLRVSFPQIIYIDYTSGIDFLNPANQEYYADLLIALQQRAAMGILAELGRSVRPGVSSVSLSEDGQSESVSYARQKRGVYGQEIEALETEVNNFVKSFRAFHKGPILMVL
jgi:hypothetical protein